jgi:DNA adenine methylase
MSKPNELLEAFYSSSLKRKKSFVSSKDLRNKIEFICRCNANKAPIRFLMSCLLAKIDRPEIDIRKPYTEIRGEDTFSGRFYDENYIQEFVYKYKLPCNATTAYLTPAFRNIDRVLTPDLVLVGRPREAYTYALQILDAAHNKQETPENIFREIIRFLLVIKEENEIRMQQLLAELKQTQDVLPLSSEEIVTLLSQHLKSKNASRLPVLIVAAAYSAVGERIGEGSVPLEAHNAADKQTGSSGDIEITLVNDDKIITSYEMKDKRVTKNDIDIALEKLKRVKPKIDNYIFITTDVIEQEVVEYAKSLYEKTAIEFAILDCIGFIRHYLHFFHRSRIAFLNIYQELVIAEPSSSVSQPLKEVFLALRRVAEADR